MSEQREATTRETGTTQDLARHMNDVAVIDTAAHTSANVAAPIPLNVFKTQACANEDIAALSLQKNVH